MRVLQRLFDVLMLALVAAGAALATYALNNKPAALSPAITAVALMAVGILLAFLGFVGVVYWRLLDKLEAQRDRIISLNAAADSALIFRRIVAPIVVQHIRPGTSPEKALDYLNEFQEFFESRHDRRYWATQVGALVAEDYSVSDNHRRELVGVVQELVWKWESERKN